jgi:hypothetical protein
MVHVHRGYLTIFFILGSNENFENFADMYLGWVYNKWELNPKRPGKLTDRGALRSGFMNTNMPIWIFDMVAPGWLPRIQPKRIGEL